MNESRLEDIVNYDSLLESRKEFDRRAKKLKLNSPPYDATREVLDTTWDIIKNCPEESTDKALRLYEWCLENLRYDKTELAYYSYRSASQTFKDRMGVCVDFTFLYVVMARLAGIDARFVDVYEDNVGQKTPHVCAGIYLNSQNITLVDITYKKFGINHPTYKIYTDKEVHDFCNFFRVRWNNNKQAFKNTRYNYYTPPDLSNCCDITWPPVKRSKNFNSFLKFLAAASMLCLTGFSAYKYNERMELKNEIPFVLVDVNAEIVENEKIETFNYIIEEVKENNPEEEILFDEINYDKDFEFIAAMYKKYLRK
ncbi:transglutaminase domain-containing protein [Candidatus Woesearchaeota archaeon]|nr:transglutaminase domain-containing protein [Candidatus Woesearchaeota archaeon]